MLSFLRFVQRELNRSAVRMLVAGAATVGASSVAMSEEPLVTNVGRFEIPFDITNETAEEDWVPAELHGQTLDFAPEQPTEHSDDDSFGAVASGHKSGAGLGADAEEEEWGAFEPDDDEQDENKSKDDSTVSEIEKTRAANNESMVSDPNVCIEALDISGVATYRL